MRGHIEKPSCFFYTKPSSFQATKSGEATAHLYSQGADFIKTANVTDSVVTEIINVLLEIQKKELLNVPKFSTTRNVLNMKETTADILADEETAVKTILDYLKKIKFYSRVQELELW